MIRGYVQVKQHCRLFKVQPILLKHPVKQSLIWIDEAELWKEKDKCETKKEKNTEDRGQQSGRWKQGGNKAKTGR